MRMISEISGDKYERAAGMLPGHWLELVFNGRVVPRWMDGTNRFWYRREVRLDQEKGYEFIVVNPETGSSEPAFDHVRLAEALSKVLLQRISPHHLPVDSLEISEDGNVLQFLAAGSRFECDVCEYQCTKLPVPSGIAAHEWLSPDGQWTAYVEKSNLFVRHMTTKEVRQLTHDGEPHYDYGSEPEATNKISRKGYTPPPSALWSPDSKKLFTLRVDQRRLRNLSLFQHVPPNEEDIGPQIHSQRYAYPGDEHVATGELVICDIEHQSSIAVQAPLLSLGLNTPFNQITPLVAWSRDSRYAYYVDMARNYRSAKLIAVEAATGAWREVVEEKSDTFLFFDFYPFGTIDPHNLESKPNYEILENQNVVWLSERDGWAHLYLFDSSTCEQLCQLTSGEWNVRRLVSVDEHDSWIYFMASGREVGRDPYYQHLYRVRLDGTGLSLLTPEDADHRIILSPDLTYFVDTYSRVDLAPVSVLRRVDGSLVRELEHADIELLLQQGYQLPKPFTVKARDSKTDLYGIMVLPAEFDPCRSYPLIEYYYGGPQLQITPKSFIWDTALLGADFSGGAQAFSQLGFITIIMDGMGTPYRSKSFHDASNGKLEEAAGMADHVEAIKQLTARHSFIDSERIGIWGVSGGGYGAARAILKHPEVYKVAVSAAGNHDQRIYVASWGERFQGLVDPSHRERYANQANAQLASGLKGKLLLAHGDMDDNVHPGHTLQLANALIQANKDFELLIMPNVGHGIDAEPYFIRRKWDYFVQHLLGLVPPKEFKIEAVTKRPEPSPDLSFLEPSGAYRIGTVTYHWIDHAREETLAEHSGDKRELMVQLWYPADELAGDKLPYFTNPELYAEALSRSLQISQESIARYGLLATNAVLDAPLATGEQQFPLLIYSHGFGALANSSTFLIEELVSRGYIVVGINHTYNCSITVFPDGRTIPFKDMGQGVRVEKMDLLASETWARDVRFILDSLEELACGNDRFAGRLDLNRVGIFGHSFGGATAAQAIMQDARLKAGMNMDGGLYGKPIPDSGVGRPFLYMYASQSFSRENLERMAKEYEKRGVDWQDVLEQFNILLGRHNQMIASGHYSLQFKTANHASYTDFAVALAAHDITAVADARRLQAVIVDYAMDFFDHYMRNKPSFLLTGEGAHNYPEVELARGKVLF